MHCQFSAGKGYVVVIEQRGFIKGPGYRQVLLAGQQPKLIRRNRNVQIDAKFEVEIAVRLQRVNHDATRRVPGGKPFELRAVVNHQAIARDLERLAEKRAEIRSAQGGRNKDVSSGGGICHGLVSCMVVCGSAAISS